MINYFNDDILASKDSLFIHGCNSKGKFASGIAGLFRKKFPYSYNAYNAKYIKDGLTLGSIIWATPPDMDLNAGPIIGNCITQENYGYDKRCYVSYDAIGRCFEEALLFAHEIQVNSITMPQIGAGLGGGDWNRIEEILINSNKLFPYIDINVYWI